jgi:hypothetical protein
MYHLWPPKLSTLWGNGSGTVSGEVRKNFGRLFNSWQTASAFFLLEKLVNPATSWSAVTSVIWFKAFCVDGILPG